MCTNPAGKLAIFCGEFIPAFAALGVQEKRKKSLFFSLFLHSWLAPVVALHLLWPLFPVHLVWKTHRETGGKWVFLRYLEKGDQ